MQKKFWCFAGGHYAKDENRAKKGSRTCQACSERLAQRAKVNRRRAQRDNTANLVNYYGAVGDLTR